MFDFFDEVIEFLSQVATIFNWGWNFIQHVISVFSGTFQQFQPVLASVPAPLTGIIIFTVAVALFDFIRGRG